MKHFLVPVLAVGAQPSVLPAQISGAVLNADGDVRIDDYKSLEEGGSAGSSSMFGSEIISKGSKSDVEDLIARARRPLWNALPTPKYERGDVNCNGPYGDFWEEIRYNMSQVVFSDSFDKSIIETYADGVPWTHSWGWKKII